MKRTIHTAYFFLALMLLITYKANAQKLEYGIRAMPAITVFKVYTPTEGFKNGKPSLGYEVAQFFAYNFTRHFALQGEFIYSDLSVKFNEQIADRKIHLRYINVPLLFTVNTNRYKLVNFNTVVGPQLGFKMESKVRTLNGDKTNNPNAVLAVKNTNLALAYGAGVDFGLNKTRKLRLGVGFRGTYGLLNISDKTEPISSEAYYLLTRTHLQTYSGYIALSFLFGESKKHIKQKNGKPGN